MLFTGVMQARLPKPGFYGGVGEFLVALFIWLKRLIGHFRDVP
jgi:hypothetical protein